MSFYLDMKKRHQAEVNAFPIHFAFGQEQIDRKIAELKLSKDPKKRAEQIVGIGGGGFVLKEDYQPLLDMFARHHAELEAAKKEDQNLYDMFRYELCNHEYGYTLSVTDTLASLGYSHEDIEKDERLAAALDRACRDIRKAEGFEW